MGSEAARPLTERQRAVMERIDRRVPIKVIANELSVSETRINQHIRALKDIYSAESLNELVETYRAAEGLDDSSDQAFSNSVYIKNQVEDKHPGGKDHGRVDLGEIVFSDALPFDRVAPWEPLTEPRVVPGVLDGDHAVLMRLAVIIGIAFGILAAVVLMVTAAMAISEALDDKATIPVDYTQPAS